ncbi:MAG: hypothetical protein GX800_09010 [Clostridiaceae bacterium]|nr:hypothetical protein [Clostridiaceae bacterium]
MPPLLFVLHTEKLRADAVVERPLIGHDKKLIIFKIKDEEQFTQLVIKQSKRESEKMVKVLEAELHEINNLFTYCIQCVIIYRYRFNYYVAFPRG